MNKSGWQLVLGFSLGFALVATGWLVQVAAVLTLHASMPEQGGWRPGSLRAVVEAAQLRLTSDDVLGCGEEDGPPAVDIS
jgi:hypothetical protein